MITTMFMTRIVGLMLGKNMTTMHKLTRHIHFTT